MTMMTPPPAQFRVMCIEDEPDILQDIVEELREHGFTVGQAANAEQALPLIDAEQPDLILCDMQMPGMSGVQLLEHLRGRADRTASIPFVFLTAFGDRETMISGRRAGADDYLVKPVDYDLLIATLESHLHNAARRGERRGPAAEAGAPAAVDDRSALLSDLAPAGRLVALVKIDNLAEIARRFAEGRSDHFQRVARRMARRAGLDCYWLNAHCMVLTGADQVRMQAVLDRMMVHRIRLREGAEVHAVAVNFSIITTRTAAGEAPAALVDRLIDAARLLQREGGNRALSLDGAEVKALRLASSIRSELVDAINKGQLHVCFQPMVHAHDHRPASAEVLVRWESPLLGHLSPATFIPVVERAGLLPRVTDWVLHQAAQSQVLLRGEGLPARLSINVGALEFTPDLPERIARIFADYGADPRLIEVEITETSLLTDPAVASGVVQALHGAGMSVALDDFGTGFSSLSYLQSCNVDAIKIDRSFVERLGERDADRKIVMGIIHLAKTLGLDTVAEGVEALEQETWLRAQGCSILQGYLISRPLAFDAYCQLLRNWAASPD